jgi:ABC-type Fe3+/spermidine/putrescine transport system ATPase subunit
MNTPFLELRGVTKLRQGRAVVSAVSLSAGAGESLAIVGPSGSGKTTLLRIVAGLEAPDDGEVWLAGRLVSGSRRIVVPPHGRSVGFVFQDLALWPHMTVGRQLDFVLKAARVGGEDRPARREEALARARIAQMADRYPHQLSGGEQQRAALARAIVGRPRLLLLDEPLSNLDPELRTELLHELVRIRRELNLTILHVTHDRDEATALGDRVLRMRAGAVDEMAAGDGG